jgi:ribosomal protein S20
MRLMDEQTSMPVQSRISSAEKKRLRRVDYRSELRSWVQQVILEAEKNKDVNKRDQFLVLLSEL